MNVFLRILSCIGAVLFNAIVYAQNITNFAGGGISLNDGGPATSAQVTNPALGAFDGQGNYYFFESFSSPRIRMVDTNGIIQTVAGCGMVGFDGDGGPATLAKFNEVNGLAVDVVGNIFISDLQNYRIRRVDAVTHIINTIAGTGTAGTSGDGGPALSANIWPGGLCVDSIGNIYYLDHGRYVRKIDTGGTITTIAGNGTSGYSGDGGQALSADLIVTIGICLDIHGSLLIGAGTRIRKINLSTGIITTVAGGSTYLYNGDEIPAVTAHVREYGICTDFIGNIYISDYTNDRIRKIDTFGIIHTVAGTGIAGYSGDGGLATLAQINHTEGVAADKCGNIYIADETNNRIRKVTFDSTCSYSTPVDTTDTTTGLSHITAGSKIEIYPNPTREQITIAGGSNAKEAAILNAMGQIIIQQKCSGYKATVDVSRLKEGMYFITVRDEKSGKVMRMKFLKE